MVENFLRRKINFFESIICKKKRFIANKLLLLFKNILNKSFIKLKPYTYKAFNILQSLREKIGGCNIKFVFNKLPSIFKKLLDFSKKVILGNTKSILKFTLII